MEKVTSEQNNFFKLNLPNKIMISRLIISLIILILLILIPYSYNWGFYFELFDNPLSYLNIICLLLFIVAAFTDFLDGYLARKNHQVTDFGKLFDPIIDKILINTTLIFFAAYYYIPIWVVVLFLIRDILVEGLRMNLAAKGQVLAAGTSGKMKTLFQLIGISIIFIFHPLPVSSGMLNVVYDYGSLLTIAMIPLYVALYFSWYSGFRYFKKSWKLVVYG